MAMLEVHNVHTYYGNIHALKGISITVEEGEIVTLIGGNGAGKSTTLKTISGLLRPREGYVNSTARTCSSIKLTKSFRRVSFRCRKAGRSSPR